MKNLRTYIALGATLIALIVATGCGKYDYVDGNHNIITKTRAIGDYTSIVMEGEFDVKYINDSFPSIDLQGESNLLEYIITEVDNKKLTIRKTRNVTLQENSTITIFCYGPNINKIETNGSGNVYFDTLQSNQVDLITNGSGDMVGTVITNDLYTIISGSGDMVIRGIADNSELRIEGSGEMDTYGCVQKDCTARILGSGDIYTYVTNKLTARIDGSGDIHYKGNPTVTTNINGSGRVLNGN